MPLRESGCDMSTLTPNPPLTPDGIPSAEQHIPPRSALQKSIRLWTILGLAGLAFAGVLAAGAYLLLLGGSEPSLTNAHTAEADEPALTSVPGYAYENPTGEFSALSQEFQRGFSDSNDQAAAVMPDGSGDFYLATSGHQVMSGAEQPDALLFLATVNPAVENTPGYEPEQILMGFAGGVASAGGTVTTETIGGEQVVTVEDDGDVAAYAWHHDGTVGISMGPDKSAVRDFTEAYLAQVNG